MRKKMLRKILISSFSGILLSMTGALAADTPQETRHELMEDVRDAAKPVGGMLKGEVEFDSAVVMESFQTWSAAAEIFGDLFPEGSETGHDTQAKASIWTDRDGFNAALASFSEAVESAIAANPQDLEALKPAAGPIFKQCKACHEDYRVEKED
jgi:cytochrome c556